MTTCCSARDYHSARVAQVATASFWRADPTFLNLVGDAPDLYGPFWVATTLIFVISVTSNLARSLANGYNYDFEVRRRTHTPESGWAHEHLRSRGYFVLTEQSTNSSK